MRQRSSTRPNGDPDLWGYKASLATANYIYLNQVFVSSGAQFSNQLQLFEKDRIYHENNYNNDYQAINAIKLEN